MTRPHAGQSQIDPSLRKLIEEHSPEAIHKRLAEGPRYNYIHDFVYGSIDGIVTTFAVVSGVAGAGLSTGIVIILGLVNLFADGFSMGVSNFLATRADIEFRKKARKTEEMHIDKYPEGEKEEIRQIYAKKGFSGNDLSRVVKVITSDKQLWADTMLFEEWGMETRGLSPLKSAFCTFASFFVLGSLPLMAFGAKMLWPDSQFEPFFWSSGMTGIAFFSVGALKSLTVDIRWFSAGLETLAVGSAAAGLAYFVGSLLHGLA